MGSSEARGDARVIEIILTFESDPAFSPGEVETIARRAARFADTTAEMLSHPTAAIAYGVEVKQVFRLLGNWGEADDEMATPAQKAEIIAGGGPRSSTHDTYTLACPHCGFEGGDVTDFNISLCDECFCPKCGERFELDDPEDGEDDE